MCRGILPTCMHVYWMYAWCLGPEEAIRSPGIRVTDMSYHVGAGHWVWVREQEVLTSEPRPQPLFWHFHPRVSCSCLLCCFQSSLLSVRVRISIVQAGLTSLWSVMSQMLDLKLQASIPYLTLPFKSTGKSVTGLWVRSQPELHSEFQANQSYSLISWLNKKKESWCSPYWSQTRNPSALA